MSGKPFAHRVGQVGFALLLTLCAAPSLAQAPAKGDPYKIGVTYPLSGPQGAWGQLALPAMEIAVQHVNEAGGIKGRPLELIIEDTKGNPEGAVSAMRKVVQVDRVQVIMTIFTNVVSAQMPLAEQFKVPLMTPIEAPGLVANSRWAFAHSPVLSKTLPLVTDHWQKQKVKRVFAFLPNTPISKLASPIIKEATQKLGIEYDEALFKLGDTDFRGLITRAKSFNPDAIFIFGHGTPDEGVIMKQVRELGMNTQMYNGCACVTVKSYREAAGKAAEGVIFSGFAYDRAAARKLADPYKARMGFDPDYAGLEIYDMIYMIAEAIGKHGYTGDGIRQGLTEIKNFKSIGGGIVSMAEDRQSDVPIGIYRLTNATELEFVPLGR
jgi:branched-chain amino acid transport system substrate-binding protein